PAPRAWAAHPAPAHQRPAAAEPADGPARRRPRPPRSAAARPRPTPAAAPPGPRRRAPAAHPAAPPPRRSPLPSARPCADRPRSSLPPWKHSLPSGRQGTVAGTPNSRTYVALTPLLSHATARPRPAWHVVRKPAPAGRQAGQEPGQPGPLNATT